MVWVFDGAVPVIVRVDVLAVVPAGTVTVRVELPPAVTLVGLKVPVTPAGSPATVSAMDSAVPDSFAVLIMYVVLEPAATVCEVGLGVMLKSLTWAPQLANLKLPMRVPCTRP